MRRKRMRHNHVVWYTVVRCGMSGVRSGVRYCVRCVRYVTGAWYNYIHRAHRGVCHTCGVRCGGVRLMVRSGIGVWNGLSGALRVTVVLTVVRGVWYAKCDAMCAVCGL